MLHPEESFEKEVKCATGHKVCKAIVFYAHISNVNILRNIDDDKTPNTKPLLSIGLCGHSNTGKYVS